MLEDSAVEVGFIPEGFLKLWWSASAVSIATIEGSLILVVGGRKLSAGGVS